MWNAAGAFPSRNAQRKGIPFFDHDQKWGLPTPITSHKINGMERGGSGFLPLITFCTLGWFYCVWAAMHDIAHGDEGTVEWRALAVCAVAFPLLYWFAVKTLAAKARLAWLIGTGLLISLFCAAGVAAMIRPKYPKDPMLALVLFAEGLPMLGIIGQRAARELLSARRGAGRNSHGGNVLLP